MARKRNKQTLRELHAEVESLERDVARRKRALVSRGEMREAIAAIEERFAAWWAGGDRDQRRAVLAATLRVPVERVPECPRR